MLWPTSVRSVYLYSQVTKAVFTHKSSFCSRFNRHFSQADGIKQFLPERIHRAKADYFKIHHLACGRKAYMVSKHYIKCILTYRSQRGKSIVTPLNTMYIKMCRDNMATIQAARLFSLSLEISKVLCAYWLCGWRKMALCFQNSEVFEKLSHLGLSLKLDSLSVCSRSGDFILFCE